jgi:hypothetical protein
MALFRSKAFEDEIRHDLGHVLLYLRNPKAWNGCDAAREEWTATGSRPTSALAPGGRTEAVTGL